MADETKDKTTEEENDQVEETSEASEEEEEVESSEASEESEASEQEDGDEDVADDSEEDDAEDEEDDAEDEDADTEDAEEEADEDEVSEASDEDDDADDEDEADDEDDSEDAEAEFADDSDEDEDEDLEEDEDEDEEEEDLFDVEPSEASEASDEDEDDDADDLDEDDEDLDEDEDESDDDITLHTVSEVTHEDDSAVAADGEQIDGLAAYFDYPAELLHAGEVARDSDFEKWDLFSPFPIHGFEESMGIGRSWLPWVTFVAGGTGFLTANAIQFGMLTFDWPMIIGGKPHAPWPSFVPIMFELTVLIGGVTTALVMLIASGCFRKPRIIDPEITNDRFVLWIDAQDPNFDQARAFMEELDPVEIRPVTFDS